MKTPYDSGLRLRKQELDSLRRTLAGLYDEQNKLEEKLQKIQDEIATEIQTSIDVPFANFAAYIERQKIARQAIEKNIAHLLEEINKIQDLIAEAFADFKTLDIAATRFIDAERARLAKLEQLQADETALIKHHRDHSEQ